MIVAFPCFPKCSPKTRKQFWAREVHSPANFVHYLPPPSCLRWCKLGQLTYSPASIHAMQRQGGKTYSCRCIARVFPRYFFAANSYMRARMMHKKNHFRRVAPIVSPFCPSIPIILPPLPTRPSSQQPTKACVGPALSYGSRGCTALPIFAAWVR